MKTRIIKKDNRFYPQYFDNGIFSFFKGWRFYKDDELALNGVFTELVKCNLSYSKLEWAKDYLESLNNRIEIVYE